MRHSGGPSRRPCNRTPRSSAIGLVDGRMLFVTYTMSHQELLPRNLTGMHWFELLDHRVLFRRRRSRAVPSARTGNVSSAGTIPSAPPAINVRLPRHFVMPRSATNDAACGTVLQAIMSGTGSVGGGTCSKIAPAVMEIANPAMPEMTAPARWRGRRGTKRDQRDSWEDVLSRSGRLRGEGDVTSDSDIGLEAAHHY